MQHAGLTAQKQSGEHKMTIQIGTTRNREERLMKIKHRVLVGKNVMLSRVSFCSRPDRSR